jgi:hypothetical protein
MSRNNRRQVECQFPIRRRTTQPSQRIRTCFNELSGLQRASREGAQCPCLIAAILGYSQNAVIEGEHVVSRTT